MYKKRTPVLKQAIASKAVPKVAPAVAAKLPKKVSKAELLQTLYELEPERIKVRNNVSVGLALLAPLVISHWLEINLIEQVIGEGVVLTHISFGAMILSAIAGAFMVWKANGVYKGYKEKFKLQVIKEIFSSIAPELSYSHSRCISQSIYSDSGLFRKKVDRYKGDDHCIGKIGQTDVEFSEIHSEYYTTRRTKNGARKQWHTIFKGLFFTAEFHKNIGGETYILPDFAEKHLGVVGKFLQKKTPLRHAKHIVQLENPIFEKEFVVCASNEQEARYCLTPDMMESFMELKNNFKKSKVYASIRGSQINIAISMSNQFEPRIWRKGVDPTQLDQMANLFQSLTMIVEQLNLNTRIWTKKAA